ncbi:outer membrane protein transport protein [Pseudoponticoccus marisrubri]|uniref:Aromatic hydrocarbon degradation protein n=1 Tax=Pseudoponticoccus marisrubri TaxID=1685382 RepID=A0A0W7WMB9_9RHOB|nr:outer membrane protein transport protein [Pseudoponticoccus marisrubri]KUF11733.1 hypothetical protein AVJ23_03870 [Pseudoponticoccus marisrubri]
MQKNLTAAAFLAASAGASAAGGIDRAANDYGLLFQDGAQLSFSTTLVNPSVSGSYPAALGGGETGNMSQTYATVSAAYKNDLTDRLALGIYINDAYGADALYQQGVYTGLRAEWDSTQSAALLRYRIGGGVSVFGGLRYVESRADIAIPELLVRAAVGDFATELAADAAAAAAAGDLATAASLGARAATLGAAVNPATNPLGDPGLNYTASGEKRGDMGYVAGIAYEIPDIAFRAALTWESSIEHAFETREVLPTLGLNGTGTTEITMPQSVALDLQSGVAPGTLVFGGVKWTEWSQWEVRPPGYESVTGDRITGYNDDILTWRLGVGRQFSDQVSGFAQVSYEKSHGGVTSRLSPTDGRLGLALGGQVETDMVKMRGGIEYVSLGDATDSSGTEFSGNSAIGVGLSFTMKF